MAIELEKFTHDHTTILDNVEDVLTNHNWVFDRTSDNELLVEVAGKHCNYRLFFIWQEDMSALQFCAQYDMMISSHNMDAAGKALMHMNENLWMGHFDIPSDTNTPSFRHTCLMRGLENNNTSAHIEDLLDIAMVQCERFYSTFHMLCQDQVMNNQSLSLALMETSGEA